ncbi:MAG: type II secretion system protein [Pseudomonadota bacterium]
MKRNLSGLTLIELLIVLVILSVLVAIVTTQLRNASEEAQSATFESNRSILSAAVERYRQQHRGHYPGARHTKTSNCPSGGATVDTVRYTELAFVSQLTNFNNHNGRVCSMRDPRAFPYGPYLQDGVPVNPFGGNNTVNIESDGVLGLRSQGTGGWRFDVITGELIGDH